MNEKKIIEIVKKRIAIHSDKTPCGYYIGNISFEVACKEIANLILDCCVEQFDIKQSLESIGIDVKNVPKFEDLIKNKGEINEQNNNCKN